MTAEQKLARVREILSRCRDRADELVSMHTDGHTTVAQAEARTASRTTLQREVAIWEALCIIDEG